MGDEKGPAAFQDEGDLVKRRLRKLEDWRERGVEPYALKYTRRDTTTDIQDRFASLADGEESGYTA